MTAIEQAARHDAEKFRKNAVALAKDLATMVERNGDDINLADLRGLSARITADLDRALDRLSDANVAATAIAQAERGITE